MGKSPVLTLLLVVLAAVGVAAGIAYLPRVVGTPEQNITEKRADSDTLGPQALPEPETKPIAHVAPGATHTAPSAGGLRIGYVNSDSLLTNYLYYKKMKAQMEQRGASAERDLSGRIRKLEAEFNTLRDRAQSGGMTQTQMAEAEQQMMRKQQELAQYKDSQAESLMNEEQKLTSTLNKTIKNYLERYSQEKGYDLILGYGATANVLYANPAMDVTKDVLVGLNQEYSAQLKK